MMSSENNPRIYVGTYGMYNNSGSLFGKWFDLTDYADAKEFYQDCYEYHRNEFDPELTFQDWENIPHFLISECSLDDNAIQYFQAIDWMDVEKVEAFKVYSKRISGWPDIGNFLNEQIDSFQDSYRQFMKDARVGYTYYYPEETILLANVSATLKSILVMKFLLVNIFGTVD